MNINFKTKIIGYDGTPMLKPGEKKGGADMTLGHMSMIALNTMQEQERDLPAEKKIHRAILSQDIYNVTEKPEANGMMDVISDDIALIKKLMNPLYGPASIKAAFDIFDPPPETDEKSSDGSD